MEFSELDKAVIKEVTKNLDKLGFYLGGSRRKLQDYNPSSPRDWDFNSPLVQDLDTEQKEQLKYYFYDVEVPSAVHYHDNLFAGYLKHKMFPHITMVLRTNYPLYVRTFENLPVEMWKKYLWKSNPREEVVPAKYRIEMFNLLYKIEWEQMCKEAEIAKETNT